MHTTRRDLLTRGAALGAALTTPWPLAAAQAATQDSAPRKLLILGGTRFLGPAIVEAAVAAGWEVTLFNRGRSNPHLFPDLDKRVGDRNEGDYASLAEGTWDACIDTSGYIPAHVAAACAALEGRVGHYTFVSTISVYDAPDGMKVVDEGAPVGRLTDEEVAKYVRIQDVDGGGYGPLKALCEEAAEAAFPGVTANVRPGLIVGPGDGSDRFTYWPVRVADGGEVLCPGDPDAEVQVVDVRDLGDFCFRCASNGIAGVMNAVGDPTRPTMQELVHAAKLVAGSDARFTWCPDEFLIEQEVRPWMGLPMWIPGDTTHYSFERAVAHGLSFRPLAETLGDTLAWHRETRDATHRWGAGITREKEAEVLAAWHASRDE